MPCDSVITNTVEFKNVKNHDLIMAGLKAFGGQQIAEGWYRFYVNGVSVDLRNGEATSALPKAKLGAVLDVVKQETSKAAVKMAAKRFGWSLEWDKKDANQFVIRKG